MVTRRLLRLVWATATVLAVYYAGVASVSDSGWGTPLCIVGGLSAGVLVAIATTAHLEGDR